MPAGVTLASIAAVLAPVGLITVVLRQLPFSFVKWMKDSQFFSLLGMMMPVGVMTILVVYTVYGQAGAKNLAISNPTNALDNADNHEYFAENTPFQN